MRVNADIKTILILLAALFAEPGASASTVNFAFSGIINNYGNPNNQNIPAGGFSSIPIPLGTPFSVSVSFHVPVSLGITPGVIGTLKATVGAISAELTNPFVAINVNHGIGPFPSGFDTIEFDPYSPAIPSGDSIDGFQVAGVSVVMYGNTGTVGISGAGVSGPIDPANFTDIKEFAVFYVDPSNPSREAIIDSINGTLVPTLWPKFVQPATIPEPSFIWLLAVILAYTFTRIYFRAGKPLCPTDGAVAGER